MGLSKTLCLVSRLQSVVGPVVSLDSPPDPERHGIGVSGQNTHTHTQVVPSLPVLLPEDAGPYLMPDGGFSGEGNKLDQSTDTFCIPPCVGHTCYLVLG